jgi:DNA-binding transcriptional regulator YhcF (GntR family)
MRWAFQQTGLKAPVKFVLVALADRANELNECFPSVEQIRADTGLSRHTICAATEVLASMGLLEKVKRFGGSVVYRLIGVPDRHQNNSNAVMRNTALQSCILLHSSSAEVCTLTNQLTDHSTSKKNTGARFAPPSVSEVADYISANAYNVDPVGFVAYYESNGWRVGRNPMKSWQHAVAGWHSREAGKTQTAKTRGRTIAEDLTDRSWAT